MCPSDTHPDIHFGSRPPFCTLTIEQAHCTNHHALPTMPQQCRMGQLIISGDNFALLADPILDTPTPFSPCPFQLFPILHPKSNVNAKDWISMYFGFFHLISLNFLFEAVTALLISFHCTEEDTKLRVICRNQIYSVSISLSLTCGCLELTLKLKMFS